MTAKRLVPTPLSIAEWCTSHGITNPKHQRQLKLRRVSRTEATKILGFDAPAGGILIPYFDITGKPTGFFRIRFDDYFDSWAKVLGKKNLRYAQPRNSGIHAYFPPLDDWQRIMVDAGCQLFVTEGEAKAGCAMTNGLACTGLGGVSSWRGTKQRQPLISELKQFDWKERKVSVVYDSDSAINLDVQREENQLAAALVDLGARVKVLRLPGAA